ncbi:MAG TPA: hypothetical protein EYN38_00570 [Flavobacteriales bacterium]|nr:hypothetical protein [Flavobacteriales bacterium]
MPKLIHYFLVLLSTLISVSNKSMASHVMGADISFVCTGPNTYAFTTAIYETYKLNNYGVVLRLD